VRSSHGGDGFGGDDALVAAIFYKKKKSKVGR
jgi:hypothetical protein